MSGDLNKYEFLKRIDLNYKPNALDKAKFEFSPLGKTFSTGLDKNVQGYKEEGVIKLLKDIRDSLARPPRPNNNRDDNDNDSDDDDDDDKDDNMIMIMMIMIMMMIMIVMMIMIIDLMMKDMIIEFF